jgi:hypothetical protein
MDEKSKVFTQINEAAKLSYACPATMWYLQPCSMMTLARGSMPKIKILFLASDPFKTRALALDEEIRAITAEIRSAEFRDSLDLVSAWAVRPEDLHVLLLQHRPHIVHFSGHGMQNTRTSDPSIFD